MKNQETKYHIKKQLEKAVFLTILQKNGIIEVYGGIDYGYTNMGKTIN